VVSSYKLPVVSSYKLPVDKLLYQHAFPRKEGIGQALEIRASRPFTGGRLLRNVMPRPSSSVLAPRY
jgi:hypothetical protein